MSIRYAKLALPTPFSRMTEQLKLIKVAFFCTLVAAALVTSFQISNVKAYGQCPGSTTRTSYSYSSGCSTCVRPFEVTKYTWVDVRWSCSNGNSYSYDEDGSCGSCR